MNSLKIDHFLLSDAQLHSAYCPNLLNAQLFYLPNFLSNPQADRLFTQLINEVPFEGAKIWMFGKELAIPRLQSWHGNSGIQYKYSGKTLKAKAWTPELEKLKQKLETSLNLSFNSVLCNLYRNGQDSMGWHSDDEKELRENPIIVSVSLGAERRFCMQHKKDKTLKWQQTLGHGSLLIMAANTQHHWRHQLPKTQTIKGARLNLTFRFVFS